jgi:hypothetical protein
LASTKSSSSTPGFDHGLDVDIVDMMDTMDVDMNLNMDMDMDMVSFQ